MSTVDSEANFPTKVPVVAEIKKTWPTDVIAMLQVTPENTRDLSAALFTMTAKSNGMYAQTVQDNPELRIQDIEVRSLVYGVQANGGQLNNSHKALIRRYFDALLGIKTSTPTLAETTQATVYNSIGTIRRWLSKGK